MSSSGTEGAEGWTVYRLPRSHWHCQVDAFDFAGVEPRSLRDRVHKFVTQVAAGESPHLIMTGAPGIGKTHLGVGIYRALAASLGTSLVTWLNVPAFCEEVKRGYKAGEPDPWEDYEGARRLVVLDDVFGRELTSHEKDQIVTRLLDTAYRNNAAVVATMNQDVKELAQRLPAHEISRLLAASTIVPMTSTKDWRR